MDIYSQQTYLPHHGHLKKKNQHGEFGGPGVVLDH
jgi:hypothetical protein